MMNSVTAVTTMQTTMTVPACSHSNVKSKMKFSRFARKCQICKTRIWDVVNVVKCLDCNSVARKCCNARKTKSQRRRRRRDNGRGNVADGGGTVAEWTAGRDVMCDQSADGERHATTTGLLTARAHWGSEPLWSPWPARTNAAAADCRARNGREATETEKRAQSLKSEREWPGRQTERSYRFGHDCGAVVVNSETEVDDDGCDAARPHEVAVADSGCVAAAAVVPVRADDGRDAAASDDLVVADSGHTAQWSEIDKRPLCGGGRDFASDELLAVGSGFAVAVTPVRIYDGDNAASDKLVGAVSDKAGADMRVRANDEHDDALFKFMVTDDDHLLATLLGLLSLIVLLVGFFQAPIEWDRLFF